MFGSVAQWLGAKADGSTPPYLVVTIIMSAWWNVTSCKLKVRSKTRMENWETKATRKRVRIRPVHSAFVVFSLHKDKNEEINQDKDT